MMATTPIHLIETLRIEPGRHMPLLAWHRRRLEQSCRTLSYTWPGEPLLQAIRRRALAVDPERSHRLRLLLAPDGGHTLEDSPLPETPTPVRVHLHPSPLRADLFWLRHKSTHRPWYEPAGAWLARNPGFFDVIFCNQDDLACEGSRCNLYIRDPRGVWLTPAVECGALPGVQRQALLDQGLARVAAITRRDLQQAEEIRISNALRGWIPAVLADPPDNPPAYS